MTELQLLMAAQANEFPPQDMPAAKDEQESDDDDDDDDGDEDSDEVVDQGKAVASAALEEQSLQHTSWFDWFLIENGLSPRAPADAAAAAAAQSQKVEEALAQQHFHQHQQQQQQQQQQQPQQQNREPMHSVPAAALSQVLRSLAETLPAPQQQQPPQQQQQQLQPYTRPTKPTYRKCKACGQRCADSVALSTHMRSDHKFEEIKHLVKVCEKCTLFFGGKYDLSKHRKEGKCKWTRPSRAELYAVFSTS